MEMIGNLWWATIESLFKDFHKRVPIMRYSEERQIFIKDGKATLTGLPYVYNEVGIYSQDISYWNFPLAAGRKY